MSDRTDRPEGWASVRLGDHTTVKARLGWKGLKAEEYVEDGYIFLATPNLKANRIDFENVNYISKWRYDESPEIQLRIGDVLIVKDGSTLGISNYVRYLPRPTTVNGSIAVVRSESTLFPEFLYHFVNGDEFQELITLKKAGLGVPHLFQADLREFAVSLPPLPEQLKIARILTTLDNLIEKTQALIAKYEAIKQGMMHDLFTRGIDAQGHLRPTQAEAPDLYKQSELGWIPKEWASPTVGSVLVHRPKNGYSPKESDEWTGTVMLGLGCLTPSGFEPIQLKNAPRNDPNLASALVRDGDLLISRSNTRDLVALVGIYRDIGTPCIYSDLMIRLVPTDEVLPEYLGAILRHAPVRRQLTNASCGTSGSMMKINAEMVLSTVISLPKHVEQRRILDRTASCSGLITQARQEHDKLRRLKTGLMQDLLTGRVRVKESESEEAPANA